MVLQPTILIMARPGNEYALDAYIRPFGQVIQPMVAWYYSQPFLLWPDQEMNMHWMHTSDHLDR
jgi:hypothetical protein